LVGIKKKKIIFLQTYAVVLTSLYGLYTLFTQLMNQ